MKFVPVAKTSEVDADSPKRVVIEDRAIAIYNLAGVFYATDDICSHGLASLSMGFIEDGLIECPLHGGAFDIATGKACKSPCIEDIRVFAVKVEDGTIHVEIDSGKDET